MSGDKRDQSEHWTKMIRPTMQTEAWQSLTTTAQALYPWLKLEWKGPKANNNGKLSLPFRTAAKAMGVSKAETISAAFHDLQAKGFIIVHQEAVLGVDGKAKSFVFELTELDMPGRDESARAKKLYKSWRPGEDFTVKRGNKNNEGGKGGFQKRGTDEEESHPENRDEPTPISGTVPPTPSQESGQPIPIRGMKSA